MSRPLLLVCATAFLLMLGLSVVFPVLPYFVRELQLDEVDAAVFLASYALASVVTAPLWGRFSDRFGRKPALLIGLAGFSLAFGLFGLGRTFWELLAARGIGGLLAAAAHPAILAYAADVSAPERRSVALGAVGAAFGLGVLAGPVVGGVLGDYHPRYPFFATAAIGALATLAVAAALPESLTPEIRAQARHRRASLALEGLDLRRIAAGLAPFLVFSLLVQTGRTGFESTIGFLVDDRFGAGPSRVGYLLFGVALMSVLVQGGGIRVLSSRYTDAALMRAGTALLALGLGGLGLAGSGWSLVAAALLLGLGAALLTPTFTAELSRAAERVQGEAQGLNASAQSLARGLGPIVFLPLYKYAGEATPYAVAAICCAIAFALARRGLHSSLEDRSGGGSVSAGAAPGRGDSTQ